MKPYWIQSFKSDLGETERAKMIVPQSNGVRSIELSGTEVSFCPEADTVYECGELTALTISGIPEHETFAVTFTSGPAATVLTVPQTMIMPDGFSVAANTRYEINCSNGYAVVAGWAVRA